jgi:acyl dehydratase
MSLAVGLTIPDTTDGTIVANLSYDNVEHPNPVFHGDTIRVQSTVTDKRETSDGERGIVTMHVEVFAVNRETEAGEEVLVCEFDRTALSLKKANAE